MVERLTINSVESAKPKAKPYEIRDSELRGLLLRVQPSGVKSFYAELARGVRARLGRYPVTTIDGARKAAKAKLGDFAKTGEHAGRKAKVVTFGEFMADYEKWVTVERKAGSATVANIKAQFGDLYSKPLTDITAWSVEKFKAARLKSGTMPATVNRDLDRIRAALTKAVEWKVLTVNPLSTVKRIKDDSDDRVRYLTKPEEKRLRDALVKREAFTRVRRISGNEWKSARGGEGRRLWSKDEYADHLTPLVLLAINTGMRRGELFSLTWESSNLTGKMLTVRAETSKSGRTRHIPLNAEAIDALKRWKKTGTGAGLVFPGIEGGRMTNINKSWAGLIELAQIQDFRFHDLRHHFASRLVMAGVDLNTVRELLGHADITMTLRYAHLAPEHKAAAVERLIRA